MILSQTQKIFEQGERTGRLLAWLARERSTTTHIAHIRDDDGLLHSDPAQINTQFMRLYELLYSFRIEYSTDSPIAFLDTIEFPELSAAASQRRDAPFTIKEVQNTVATLQTAKTLGPDGLPAEVYKTHIEVIVSHFHKLLQTVLEEDCIPIYMTKAVIVVVPKPG